MKIKYSNKELRTMGFTSGFTQGDFYWRHTLKSLCFTKDDRSEMEVLIRGKVTKVNNIDEAIKLLSRKTSSDESLVRNR